MLSSVTVPPSLALSSSSIWTVSSIASLTWKVWWSQTSTVGQLAVQYGPHPLRGIAGLNRAEQMIRGWRWWVSTPPSMLAGYRSA